jgi:hypothetical protein
MLKYIRYLIVPFIFAALVLVLPVSILAQPRGLNVVASAISDSTPGRQIAVLIAVDRYREWLPLRFPVRDAKALKQVLNDRYYITDTVELYNEDATKAGILKRFDQLSQELKPEDSVLIYYAGHGHLDSATDLGFWIPQDAGTDQYAQANWLPNAQIRALIGKMKARHVMLVSDSCFSGDILNTSRGAAPEISNDYFKNAYARRSRQVLTSGASEAVPDESAFSRALIKTLQDNTKPYVDPYMLFGEIRLSQVATTPLFGTLNGTDHQDGGSFVLFLKENSKESVQVATSARYDSTKPGRFILPSMLPGTGLEVNGRPVALLPVAGSSKFESSELSPGDYKVQVTGKYPYSETLALKPESRIELTGWHASALAEAQSKRVSTEKALSTRSTKLKVGFTSLSLGVVGSIGAVTTMLLGNAAKDDYNAAQTTEALAEARDSYELMQKLFIGSAIAGGIGFVVSPFMLTVPKKADLERVIQELNDDIRALGGY